MKVFFLIQPKLSICREENTTFYIFVDVIIAIATDIIHRKYLSFLPTASNVIKHFFSS